MTGVRKCNLVDRGKHHEGCSKREKRKRASHGKGVTWIDMLLFARLRMMIMAWSMVGNAGIGARTLGGCFLQCE